MPGCPGYRPRGWTDADGHEGGGTGAVLDILDIAGEEKDSDLEYDAANGIKALEHYYNLNEQVIARLEGRGRWDSFRLIQRLPSGAAVEFSHFADRRPEAPCKAFKARQLYVILAQLKDLMEEGLVALTVPDKPNSRNQRYITLRTV